MKISTPWLALGATLVSFGTAQAQVFVQNTADIPSGNPFNNSNSENVDFADVDLDGDWDAVFADGGDFNSDQNRIWINQGFAQGGTLGVFVDQTSTRFPAVIDTSRDIEFVDFERDGDFDLYVSNTSTVGPQSNRWWVNMGGAQGGSAGFYQDQTAARWVGLGGPGSSIPPFEVLGTGGFLDFSCDCDFGDLDNDGDLDLFHSSYGGIFGGQIPSRVFLNDGQGFFSEFNPSGFQLSGQNINNGNPGIWCEGTHTTDTTNSTGAQCDVASTPLDIDVGDVDGDLDLDVLHGARQELPRLFKNRLAETGALGFRDVTGASFLPGYSTGGGHYEQEMGDLDGDGDLDIYGLNWQGSLEDETLPNNGDGTFAAHTVLANSGSDDNEGDFVDYDQDGDIDLFVASFSGSNRLYRNNNNGSLGGFTMTEVLLISPSGTGVGLDGEGCDVDEDGDTDVFVGIDGGGANTYYKNASTGNDVHAPSLFALEQAPDRAAGPAPTVVRVQVYDNAPYYITWYNPTVLEVSVDGGAPFTIPMQTSQGQVFRGEIPGGLSGTICYRAISSDDYGNTGTSNQLCYEASSATAFCDASDGALASCPCANPGAPDTGCDNSQATGGVGIHVLAQSTSPNAATLVGSGFSAMSSPTAIVIRSTSLDPSSPVVFGDGLRCINASPLVRLAAATAVAGTSTHVFGHSAGAGAGTFYYQIWYRNTPPSFCTPDAFNLSNGEQLVW